MNKAILRHPVFFSVSLAVIVGLVIYYGLLYNIPYGSFISAFIAAVMGGFVLDMISKKIKTIDNKI